MDTWHCFFYIMIPLNVLIDVVRELIVQKEGMIFFFGHQDLNVWYTRNYPLWLLDDT